MCVSRKKKYCKHLQMRPIMNSSDVAEVEEPSEPEFKEQADVSGISTSRFSSVFSAVYRAVAVVVKKVSASDYSY